MQTAIRQTVAAPVAPRKPGLATYVVAILVVACLPALMLASLI